MVESSSCSVFEDLEIKKIITVKYPYSFNINIMSRYINVMSNCVVLHHLDSSIFDDSSVSWMLTLEAVLWV